MRSTTIGYVDGTVEIFRASAEPLSGFRICRAGRKGAEDYPVLGGFHVANNDGAIVPVSLFLRHVSRGRTDPKTAAAWAVDLKQWVAFIDRMRRDRPEPPYAFDLYAVGEPDLLLYRAFLLDHVRNREGEPLAGATVSNKLRRICAMHQQWADWGWFLGDLGPEAEVRRRARGGYARGGDRNAETAVGPTGSAHAVVRGGRERLPRTVTASGLAAIDMFFSERLDPSRAPSPRREQDRRNFLVYALARTVGLRVEEISRLDASTIAALKLAGARPTETRNLPVRGKFSRTGSSAFTVELLRQLQDYASGDRLRAVLRGGGHDPQTLFVVHVGVRTGAPLRREGMQRAMAEVFVAAGLCERVPLRDARGGLAKDTAGRCVFRRRPTHSIHDLRHTCACETFYALVAAYGDDHDTRMQALERVRRQLRHADIETTQTIYAALTERYSTWLAFGEGVDADRAMLADVCPERVR